MSFNTVYYGDVYTIRAEVWWDLGASDPSLGTAEKYADWAKRYPTQCKEYTGRFQRKFVDVAKAAGGTYLFIISKDQKHYWDKDVEETGIKEYLFYEAKPAVNCNYIDSGPRLYMYIFHFPKKDDHV